MIIAMNASPYFGYGVCAANLLREFSLRGEAWLYPLGELIPWGTGLDDLIREKIRYFKGRVDEPVLTAAGPDLEPQIDFRGSPTIGLVFSEWEPITAKQVENLKKFDIVIAGSEWNAEVIRKAGVECVAVQQGVDTSIFHSRPALHPFSVFSGGKFEHRKGQDLVIQAMRELRKTHPEIQFICTWENIWDQSWRDRVDDDLSVASGVCTQQKLSYLMSQTDVGLFPNRCEGGTNLVMMEYLACGRPVIATFGTGHKDVLDHSYALELKGTDSQIVDGMVSGVVELLYDKKKRLSMGERAEKAMQKWSWKRMADAIEKIAEVEYA